MGRKTEHTNVVCMTYLFFYFYFYVFVFPTGFGMLVGTRNTSRGSTDGLTSHPVSVTPTPPTSGFVQDGAFRI